jgi:hypothetical protein
MKGSIIASTVVACLVLLAGCGGSGGSGASNNAKLESLSLSEGILYPAFSPEITDYTVELPSETGTLTAIGRAVDAGAEVGGQSGKAVALSDGENTIAIDVTAEDGTTRKYDISAYRNYWTKWVDTSKGALDSDLSYTTATGSGESARIVENSANLMWSMVQYQCRMKAGVAYTVSFKIRSSRITDFLSVYQNDLHDNSQYSRSTLAASTTTDVSYTVTPPAGVSEAGAISFRAYPDDGTIPGGTGSGHVDACTLDVSNIKVERK